MCYWWSVYHILAYADDVVVSPSWGTMQLLLSLLNAQSVLLDLTCNANRTVCMVFTPKSRKRIVSSAFSRLKIVYAFLQLVDSFKYLGYYIVSDLIDDTDILKRHS